MARTRRALLVPIAAIVGVGAGFLGHSVAAENGARPAPDDANSPAIPLAAHLKGAEETPGPGDPDGFGVALVTANPTTGLVCIEVSTTNVDTPWTLAHIHEGEIGVAGPPVVDFGVPASGTGPELTTCVTVADLPLVNAIVETPSNYYVNVHNEAFPNGAVRGQLVARSSETQFVAPTRVYDSRADTAGPLAVDATRIVDLQLPAGVRAALVTLTVDRTSATGGFLTLYAADEPSLPPTSTINWTTSGQAIATTTIVAVDRTGQVKVTAGQGGTDFIIDVLGYVL